MGRKRSKIRKQYKKALEKGKHVDPKMLASCYGKARFDSMERAKEDLYHTQKAYKCRFCKFYHRGRKPRKS